jgi:hypothetical protein
MPFLLRNVRAGKRRAALEDLQSIAFKTIVATMDKRVGPALVKSFENVVKDWEHRPDFQAKKIIKPTQISIEVIPVGPNAKIFVFVDQGTRPHMIVPRQKRALKFQGGTYKPKTLPSPARTGTVSGGGRTTGGQTVFAKKVNHPGTKARNFSVVIAGDILPDFRREIEKAFRLVALKVDP